MLASRAASRALLRASRKPLIANTRLQPLCAAYSSDTKKPAEPVEPIARLDPNVTVEYPEDHELKPSLPVRGYGRLVGGSNVPTFGLFSLQDKVCVVTGAARGLGLVMGQGIVTSGADLAIVDLNQDEAAVSAKNLTEAFKRDHPNDPVPRITAHYADVADPESVDSCIADIIKTHGRIDSLVTSAGFTENWPALEYPIDRYRKLQSVNVEGTWSFAIGVAKHLKERKAKGSMVFIGSMSGSIVNVPQPQAPYNGAKAAVRHMAASLGVEWAELGIRVNNISPGYMLTSLTQNILDNNPELKAKWESLIPMAKLGNPTDLIGPVTFLLSDAAGYMTGADLRVDGGYTVL